MMRGQCHCGGVALELDPPTLFASYCHCETCRRIHAAPFVAWTAVPIAQHRLTKIETLAHYASSPGVDRLFCSRCGTSIAYLGTSTPDRVYVPIAVLDTIDRELDSHVSYEERAPWLDGLHALPCFEAKSTTPLRWR